MSNQILSDARVKELGRREFGDFAMDHWMRLARATEREVLAELAKQEPAANKGHCRKGDDCECGGDLPRVREGCYEWVQGAAPIPQQPSKPQRLKPRKYKLDDDQPGASEASVTQQQKGLVGCGKCDDPAEYAWHQQCMAQQPSESEALHDEQPYSTEWWLADVTDAGNLLRLSDGAHSERAGADKAAYLHAELGLKHARKFAVARVELFEAKPSSEGVNMQAVDDCNSAHTLLAKQQESS